MINYIEYDRRVRDLFRQASLHTYGSTGAYPFLAFVERAKAQDALGAKAWMEVTDAEVIEYAKATWKPHPSQADLVTCDPSDPTRVDVICVVLAQV